ncbi:tRNA pseudouridine(38-40) synthase TruA [Lentimicrobium sp.]
MHEWRYCIELAYHGGRYHGWQLQPNAVTVQQKLEEALHMISRYKIRLTGAGRTDTGVHARRFFAHFDLSLRLSDDEIKQWVYRLNRVLAVDIVVYAIHRVSADFHARFTAISRTYRYFILKSKDPFQLEFAYRPGVDLNVEQMRIAADIFKQYSHFSCFTKSNTQVNNYNCNILESVLMETENMLIYQVSANRFLRNMVRAMVGTLLEAGKGRMDADALHQLLVSGTRSDAGESVPAKGLFLENILYPAGSFGQH